MNIDNSPYLRGIDDEYAGVILESCPYPNDSLDAQEWEEGWWESFGPPGVAAARCAPSAGIFGPFLWILIAVVAASVLFGAI